MNANTLNAFAAKILGKPAEHVELRENTNPEAKPENRWVVWYTGGQLQTLDWAGRPTGEPQTIHLWVANGASRIEALRNLRANGARMMGSC